MDITIFDLPLEIIEEILKKTNYLSKFNFVQTSKIFYDERYNLIEKEKMPRNECKLKQCVKNKNIYYLKKYQYVVEEIVYDKHQRKNIKRVKYEDIQSLISSKNKDLDFYEFYLMKLKISDQVNKDYNYYLIIASKFAILFNGRYIKNISYVTFPHYLKYIDIITKDIDYFNDNFIYTKTGDIYKIHPFKMLQKYSFNIGELLLYSMDNVGGTKTLFIFLRRNNKLYCIGKYVNMFFFSSSVIIWHNFQFLDKKIITYNMRRKAKKAFERLIYNQDIDTVGEYIDMMNFD